MKSHHTTNLLLILAASSLFSSHLMAATIISNYTENFDSMGASGTTPPTDWKHLTFNMTGTSNATWSTTIPASGTNSVASIPVTTASTTLAALATTIPTATNNNGYNAPLSTSATTDRVIATSPTTTAGAGIQVLLTNGNADSISDLSISFDTVRYNAASTANELPGYWVFISSDGTNWTNMTPTPTILTVPNTIGVTATTLTASGLSIAPASNFYLRWMDDNAAQTSPDQIIGLNNVSVTATTNAAPEPNMIGLLGLAGLGMTLNRRRKIA